MGWRDLLGRRSAQDPVPDPLADDGMRKRVVHAYHEQTKHGFHRFAAGPQDLDWANQPDPFRRFEGAPLRSLEVLPPTPGSTPGSIPGSTPGSIPGPTYDGALVQGAVDPAALDRRSISQLLYDSLALSAWKQAGDVRWALRINPSSGNLHPTEGYLLLPALPGLCDGPCVAHYAPREHGLELRAEIPAALWERLVQGSAPGSFFVGLTSIHWREAWKYGERAFRYCQHDTGHALGALSIAAAGLGWGVELVDEPGTEELAQLFGVFAQAGPEAEQPECLLRVSTRPGAQLDRGTESPAQEPASVLEPGLAAEFRALAWQGRPVDLSPEHVEWEAIDLVARAAHKPRTPAQAPWSRPRGASPAPRHTPPLRQLVRQRRSCLGLDRQTGMDAQTFFGVLERMLPQAQRAPWNALPWSPRLHLAIFVHRVEGLHPGLYWLQRDPQRSAALRAACRSEFLWQAPEGCPAGLPLSLLLPLDLRRQAAMVSCNQDIAGDGAFSLGMIADFEHSIEEYGPWFYPRLFWEAGLLGQLLYLEAEACGLRGTGIGCFFDDGVHGLLGLQGRAFQSLYHFTVGKPVEDDRLTTLPAYPAPTEGPDAD